MFLSGAAGQLSTVDLNRRAGKEGSLALRTVVVAVVIVIPMY
jgi:hypothetical protein